MTNVPRKYKAIYYYLAGAFALLLVVKFLASNFFGDAIDFILTYLPFIIIAGAVISGMLKYKKNPENIEVIKRKALNETFFLLLITLLFYILYSPKSFVPIMESLEKMGAIFSIENFFLILSYLAVVVIALSSCFVAIRAYQKSQGTYQGSVNELFKKTLYSVFFIMFFMLLSSAAVYPRAYSPITGLFTDIFYVFMGGNDSGETANKRVTSLGSVLGETFNNLKSSLGESSEGLSTTIAETKSTLDNAITRTNKDLKESLGNDIEDKLGLSGGTLSGNLTLEDRLIVEDTATTRDVLPDVDDSYDLGSVSKGWENVYVHALHGSSIVTVGSGSTSHGINDTDDMLISGDFEVNGTTYLDGAITLAGAVTFSGTIDANGKVISNVADPVSAQDAVTRAYYEANTPTGVLSRTGTTLSPTTSGDSLDMGSASIGGGTITGTSLTDGTATLTLGALSGVTTLGMGGALSGVTTLGMNGALSGVTTGAITTVNSTTVNATTLDVGTNTITGGNLTGDWAGLTSLTVDNVNINGNTIITSSGDLTINTSSGSTSFNDENITNVGSIALDSISADDGTISATFGSNDFNVDSNTLVVEGDTNKVGIGTASPASLLELYSSTDAILTLTSTHATDYDPQIQFKTDGTPTVKFSMGVDSGDSDKFKIAPGTAGIGNTSGFVIDSSGITYISSLQSGAQTFENDAGVVQWIDLPVTTATTGAGTVESYSAMLDGAAVLTIYGTAGAATGTITDDTIGVGIGTSTPGAMLHVYDDKASDYVGEFYNDGNNANRYGLKVQVGADDGSGTTYYLDAYDGDGGQVGYLANVSGTFAVTDPSDIRTKTNISNTAILGLDIINKLRVVDYNRIQNPDGPTLHGFIAQEVQEVFPDMVVKGNDGMLGIMKESLIPVLTKAIQEQQGQIKETQDSVEGLDLKTNENVTTLAELQESIDEQLASIDERLTDTDNSIINVQSDIITLQEQVANLDPNNQVNLVAQIQEQMDNIQDENKAIMDFFLTINPDTLVYKDSDGNLNLLDGKLEAGEVVAGVFTVKVVEESVASIGSGKILAIVVDDNEDGIDDDTNSDGKSVVIETEAVSSGSKVFVTAKSATDQPLAVTEIDDRKSFTVEVSNVVVEDLEFDWWIVNVN